MRIVIAFVGGGMDGKTIVGDSRDAEPSSLDAMKLYLQCDNGKEGSRFSVPAKTGNDIYEVCRKLVHSESVIVRARHVAIELDPTELRAILCRR